MASGLSREEAHRRARLEFGSMIAAQEECREANRWDALEACSRNLRYAFRSLLRNPGFAAIAIAILAMGMGSTLAVFNLADALMLRPLPVRNAAELVRISALSPQGDLYSLPSTILQPLSETRDYQGVCGFDTEYPGVEVDGTVTPVGALGFSADCFTTLGIRTQLGRALTPEDDRLGTEPATVITDAFWARMFDRRVDVLGKRVTMDGATYTIVGVAEPQFKGLLVGFPAGLIVPVRQKYTSVMPNGRLPIYWWVNVLARRRPGVSEEQARARLRARSQWLLEESLPPHYDALRRKNYLETELAVTSGRNGVDYFLKRRFGTSLYAAAGICSAILLIGCINLANLLLARSLRRRHEMTVRFALGAKRSHVAGLFATESLVLVAAGSVLAVLLAQALDHWLVSDLAGMFGNFDLGLSFDWRIALFLAAIIAAITAGLAASSAWQADRFRGGESLRECGRGVVSGTGATQKILMLAQIVFTLTLVAVSSLFSASLRHLYAIDLGVQTRDVWDVMLSDRPGAKRYFNRGPYYRELLDEIRNISGVKFASLADFVPFFTVPDPEPIAAIDTGNAHSEVNGAAFTTSADFFRTLGIKIKEGAEFEEKAGGEPVVLISESLASRLSPSPSGLIGHHIRVGTDSRYQRLRIGGVVSNAKLDLVHPEELAPPAVYLNIWQHPDEQGYPVLLIKTEASSLDIGALRKLVDARGHQYVDRVRTLSNEKDGALIENKLLAYLSESFSILALIMAATGLFGLLSYQLASRTGEIGIRMALGAERGQIRWMVLRQIIVLVATGSVLGITLSLATGRMIAGLLYGISPYNPGLLVLSCGVLMAASLGAAWLPVQRASSIDPATALRHE